MAAPAQSKGLWYFFAGTIVLSAFLLFLVQPLIAKQLLPWFGGTTGVWATCVVFFQIMLCAGYGYAHAIRRWLPPRQQMLTHLTVLGLSILTLPIRPSESWEPTGGDAPLTDLILLLLRFVGLPYFALSTTGPLLQSWFSEIFPGRTPYRLYALSNIGSLVSLLMFPFVFEPLFGLWWLSTLWTFFYFSFALLCGWVTWRTYRLGGTKQIVAAAKLSPAEEPTSALDTPGYREFALWILLPAVASYMLVAATNHLCMDVASVPFLWILPLCLYLLSFIISFDRESWYNRPVYALIALGGLYMSAGMYQLDHNDSFSGGVLKRGPLSQGLVLRGMWPVIGKPYTWMGWHERQAFQPKEINNWVNWLEEQQQIPFIQMDFLAQILAHCVGLFGLFMICHGELARRKPAAQHLTRFYLYLSIGGALGGAAVSLGAPYVFNEYTEWVLGLVICLLWAGGMLLDQPADQYYRWRLYGLALPSLLLCCYVLYQNSNLPEWVVRICDYESYILHLRNLENNQLTGALPEGQLLGAGTVLPLIIVLLTVGAIGIWSYRLPTAYRDKARFWVINLSLLLLICYVVFDVLNFLELSKGIKEFAERLSAPPPVAVVADQPDAPNVTNSGAAVSDPFPVEDNQEDARKAWVKRRVTELQLTINPDVPAAADDNYSLEINLLKLRNWYGAFRVEEELYPNRPEWSRRQLLHGRILHGNQYMDSRRVLPTTYYAPESGVGLAIGHFKREAEMRIGAVGLGTGTLAAYVEEAGHRLTIYEINPAVRDLVEGTNPYFTYVRDARQRAGKPESVEIVIGDARLRLQQEVRSGTKRNFDVLVVDAFSGDSIPTHLLTREAYEIYRQQLRTDGQGILALHISNRFLDLAPVCRGLAEHSGLSGRILSNEANNDGGISSTWVLLTNNRLFLDETLVNAGGARPLFPDKPNAKQARKILWTDDYTNLYELINTARD